MKNSFLMLKSLLENLKSIDGIIFYSLFMLPYKKIDRKKIFNLIIKKKKKLIFALEEIKLQNSSDIKNIENIFNIKKNSIKL